ncbi:MAG: type II toxin-antitoxin system PrlF family antitoxin [Deltaproteobacteria bacterium]|nr:type II toxin-antitoxin system PrlF family antitoxin [Deltaproteobacteria bacterium]
MNYQSTMTERGQITVPKEIRDQLGLKAGVSLTFTISKQGIVVKKAASSPKTDWLSKYRGIIKSDKSVDEIIEEMRGKVE